MTKTLVYYTGPHMQKGAYEVEEDHAREVLQLEGWQKDPPKTIEVGHDKPRK